MTLRDVQTVWGGSRLVRSRPLVETHHDVIFVPLTEGVDIVQDSRWGLFSRDGRLIQASGYFRGKEHCLVCHNHTTDLDINTLPVAPEEHYIYGGPIIYHFGHFLITSMARLWCLERTPLTAPLLCHSHGPIPNWFHLPYRGQLWDACGIDQTSFATFDRPTRIRSITIPRVSLEEQNFVHETYGRMCRRIGDILIGDTPIRDNSRPVYLSKHLMKGGVTKIGNEDEIISVFQDAGIDIIAPETLSFVDQIRLFRERRVIIGTPSSAFHMSAFSARANDIFCLLPNDLLNSNFLLIDKIANNKSRYLFSTKGFEAFSNSEGFSAYSIINSPREVAQELLDRIE